MGYAETVMVNGKSPPEQVLEQFRRQNIFENVPREEDLGFIGAAKTLEVQDGKVILKR